MFLIQMIIIHIHSFLKIEGSTTGLPAGHPLLADCARFSPAPLTAVSCARRDLGGR
jgi:hypothetical protein